MLVTPSKPTVATHWGTYRAQMQDGKPVALVPFEGDPDPSPIGDSMIGALDDKSRISKPAVRESFLRDGHRATGTGRGKEPFVEVDWQTAFDLVGCEIERVRKENGNKAIYGGSYGWSSAGRFHHAQSQIHRFLNAAGGYTRSVQNYSFAAGDIIMKHIVGSWDGLAFGHTTWPEIAEHTQTVIAFGGISPKNSQVSAGGIGQHNIRSSLQALRENGAKIFSITPIRDDMVSGMGAQWYPVRPGADVALMLGIAHTLLAEDLYDITFLKRFTVGHEVLIGYVTGEVDKVAKTAQWASELCDIPADDIRALARRMAGTRTMITVAWSLQRGDHGEQPCWMVVALAALLGQVGLPGGGFGIGYGSVNGIGNPVLEVTWPSLPQLTNPVKDYIPVARISDMLDHPNGAYEFNGEHRTYPDIRMVYWAGGNPFHHHQDINKLIQSWRKPETVIVHDSWWNGLARHADIVLPVTTQLERNDLVCAKRDNMLAASHRISAPYGMALSDYEIFAGVAERLGVAEAFTENRSEEDWIRAFFATTQDSLSKIGHELPDFDRFWEQGVLLLPEPESSATAFQKFRADPLSNPLLTPSGKIELFSETIAGFGYTECPGHPIWQEPAEWLGAKDALTHPLHLISNQPKTKLHSQYDQGTVSIARKVNGREPVRLHPMDAASRDINNGDVVRIFNSRGACLAGAILSDDIKQGVVQLSVGAWYDPLDSTTDNTLDKHGNPNVLTRDQGTSRLSQAPSPHSCLVQIERFDGPAPPITAFEQPQKAEPSK